MLTRACPHLAPRPRRLGASVARGLTLIELMVTIALLALLLGLAAPSFSEWTRNTQVRTVADGLQNGARLAQAEAVRRNRQVVFFLTNNAACTLTGTNPADDGAFWAIRTVPLVAGDPVEMVQCGQFAEVAAGVAIDGPTAICFNSMGRQVVNAAPGIGTTGCTLDASGTSTYNLSMSGSNRPLRVLVTLGGQVRLCDPARTLSTSHPDGCPA
jgi:type IV fimbrial biogenesis protein FimT